MSRSKDKKTSFRMMLHREAAITNQQTMNLKAEDNECPVIVTMGQEENPEMREMLNKFYETDKNSNKNVSFQGFLKEFPSILIKSGFFRGFSKGF